MVQRGDSVGEVESDEVGEKSVLLILNGHSTFTLRVYRDGQLNRRIAADMWDSVELTEEAG